MSNQIRGGIKVIKIAKCEDCLFFKYIVFEEACSYPKKTCFIKNRRKNTVYKDCPLRTEILKIELEII
jgi:hypothetical protein